MHLRAQRLGVFKHTRRLGGEPSLYSPRISRNELDLGGARSKCETRPEAQR